MFDNLQNAVRFDLKRMIGIHQGRERSDVLLAIVLPAVLMLVSAYTNAWAFTGGNLSFSGPNMINTIDAICRGLFVEALVFSCFKIVKMLCSSGKWYNYPAALVPALVGLVGVVVSSGCGLAWVAKSGSMDWMIKTVSAYLPGWMTGVFQAGIGLLFPVALAVLAIYDISSLIEEHISRGAQLGGLALRVQSAEHHQTMLLQAQKTANNDPNIKNAYQQMAQTNAQQAVDAARRGDYTFGLSTEPLKLTPQQQSSVTRISPPAAYPSLAAPAGAPPMPMGQPPFINGQVTNNPPFMGNTQQLNVGGPAPLPAAPPQKNGLFSWMTGK
ncbi:hypothetical protein [Dictyobacter arantiisoli]|uniref:Uncharacterized protein n=1 Tax=Dictyobacter arantiisoli TaxID=2014874 RepID=A0A5A5TAQ8_9CHLR|nr:hypothetical protein [Dictyobacter arantiisoli]GCF08093.1 hypothetical protein KDI_16570 [Dictyobacter arantiisoli]